MGAVEKSNNSGSVFAGAGLDLGKLSTKCAQECI